MQGAQGSYGHLFPSDVHKAAMDAIAGELIVMRDQYAGDISDFFKFSFLRAVVPDDAVLGVAWYYVQRHDGGPDGRQIEYWSEDRWRVLDDKVFFALSGLTIRSVEALEKLPIWKVKTLFHRTPLPALEET